MSEQRLSYGSAELRRGFRIERVSVGAQLAHPAGNSMSQRECSGFNGPPAWLSGRVSTQQPINMRPSRINFPRIAYCVGQRATVLRLESEFPASLFPFCAGVPAIGVGHPASGTAPGNLSDPCAGPPFGPSCVQGVGQPTSCTAIGRISPKPFPLPILALMRARRSSQAFPLLPVSIADGVGQPASWTALGSSLFLCSAAPARPRLSAESGVGHPDKIKALAYVRPFEPRSAQIARPEGVTRTFQVSRYKIEPVERARNLLSKDDCRAALADKLEPDRPEVAIVVEPLLLSGGTEGLAGAGSSPHRNVICPSGPSESMAPHSDACEEMALREASKVIGRNLRDAALVHFTRRDVADRDQVAQPLRGKRVAFVVVGAHRPTPGKIA